MSRICQLAIAGRLTAGSYLSESDKREIGEHFHPPYDHKGVVLVASAWLAFYVFAIIHDLIAFGN